MSTKKKGKMSPTKIDWPGLTHTWNPMVGCKHGGEYCIAEQWNDRYKWIPKWNEPQIFENRIEYPYNHSKPCSIFVEFTGDLFGNWVDSDFIRRVLKVCHNTPQHKYWFLTKNPRRYKYFNFPSNCTIGITLTGQKHRVNEYQDIDDLANADANSYFISCEPLLGKISVVPSFANLIIVGAQTGKNTTPPKKEYINSVRSLQELNEGQDIYYKKNIREYL